MLEVRFIRFGKFDSKGRLIRFNSKLKGVFKLKFKDVEDLIKFFKEELILKESGNFPRYRIVALNLKEDLSDEDFRIFIRKYNSILKKYRQFD